MRKQLLFVSVAVAVLAICASTAFSTAHLIFGGGNGAPMTITLTQTVTYTANGACTAGGNGGPLFVFKNTGATVGSTVQGGASTITFSYLGGVNTVDSARSSATLGSAVTTSDTYMYSTNSIGQLNNGATVTLLPGTFTTGVNIANPPPAANDFVTYISGNTGTQCSNNGIGVTTAAAVPIWGRVFTAQGRGLANAVVDMTDAQGVRRITRTNAFGYFRFDRVAAGQSVVISVASRSTRFAPRVVNIQDAVTSGIDFIADH